MRAASRTMGRMRKALQRRAWQVLLLLLLLIPVAGAVDGLLAVGDAVTPDGAAAPPLAAGVLVAVGAARVLAEVLPAAAALAVAAAGGHKQTPEQKGVRARARAKTRFAASLTLAAMCAQPPPRRRSMKRSGCCRR